jgi:hypothetical protein
MHQPLRNIFMSLKFARLCPHGLQASKTDTLVDQTEETYATEGLESSQSVKPQVLLYSFGSFGTKAPMISLKISEN